jgi:predicted PhzF superfamily epimerase YddE/YHI9
VPPETLIEFHTKSGRLTARHVGDKIELDFPSRPAVPTELPSGLTAALSAEHTAVLRNEMDLLLEFADEQVLKSLEPDFPALDKIPGIRGVIVTSASQDPEYDFISRFFAPAVGINEDPVTGSAHCALAPYWAAKLGRATLTGYQASGRGGVVETEIRGDRVLLRGSAVTILRSELAVDLM